MKQSRIVMSILIAGGISAFGYAFVSTHNPCVGDRSYECLFGQKDVQIADLTGQNSTGENLSVPDNTQQIIVPIIKNKIAEKYSAQSDTVKIDTTLADQAAAAKLAKEEADAQILAIEQQAAKLAAQQAAADKLVAQEAADLERQQAATLAAQQQAALAAQQSNQNKEEDHEYEEDDD